MGLSGIMTPDAKARLAAVAIAPLRAPLPHPGARARTFSMPRRRLVPPSGRRRPRHPRFPVFHPQRWHRFAAARLDEQRAM